MQICTIVNSRRTSSLATVVACVLLAGVAITTSRSANAGGAPVFHLDFSAFEDVSGNDLPLLVGDSVSLVLGGGPLLENGNQLDAARWHDETSEADQILILDNPVLDGVSVTAGSIVTWMNPDEGDAWNNILKTVCPQVEPCPAFGPDAGFELHASGPHAGVYGAVQGWSGNGNVFGPLAPEPYGPHPNVTDTPTGMWSHIALTWNDQGDRTVYLNGLPGPRQIGFDSGAEFGLNQPGDWSLGGDALSSANDLDQWRRLEGMLADFAIYDGELSQAQISEIMRTGVAPFDQPGGINNWLTGQTIPGTEDIIPGPGIDLSDWNNEQMNLRFADLANVDLSGATFDRSWLNQARFIRADLPNASLVASVLDAASFRQANLTAADFSRATLTDVDFTNAVVTGTSFADTTSRGFTGAQLYSTVGGKTRNLQGIVLSSNDLSGWGFSGTDLTNANFQDSDLSDAILEATNFTNANLSQVDLTDADARYASLNSADLSNANLTGTYFLGARFTEANFSDAVVTRTFFLSTDLTEEQLYSTASYRTGNLERIVFGTFTGGNDLSNWNFVGQNLSHASMQHCNLTHANLSGANLSEANLGEATLTDADLSGADLSKSMFWYTKLGNADFSDAVVVGTNLSGATYGGFVKEQLYSTASYKTKNLEGIGLGDNNLTGWNFVGQNLTGADLSATLTNADLTGAVVAGADISQTTSYGFTKQQLYSTASYQSKNLEGIHLAYNDLSGWSFAQQNLAGALFDGAVLTDTNFSLANLAEAGFASATLTNANLAGANFDSALLGSARSIHGTYNQWTKFPVAFDPAEWELTLITSALGDLDGIQGLMATDVDLLSNRIRDAEFMPWQFEMFDLNRDEAIDPEDQRFWVEDLKQTWFGDADLDGQVDFADYLTLSANFAESGGWAQGDFDGDGEVQFSDFLILSANFGKTQSDVAALPEPSAFAALFFGIVGSLALRRRRL